MAETGEVPGPLGARHPSITPFDAFAAADGHLIIAAGNDTLFKRLCSALSRDDLHANPLFTSNALRTEHNAALKTEMEAALAHKTVNKWLEILQQAGIPCGPINNVEQVLNDPHVNARNMVVTADDPVAGRLKMAGNPIKISGVEDRSERKPAPELDADRERVLGQLPGIRR